MVLPPICAQRKSYQNGVRFFILGFGYYFSLLAPYIITDLLHLRMSDQYLMWLDVLVITSFAYNGLVLFFLSLLDMEMMFKSFFASTPRFYIMNFILFLTGFGIYLGQLLRYNSWEILQNL